MHDLQFSDAVRTEPVRTLRLAMQPYSLGHEVLLFRQRNPLVLLSAEEFATLEKHAQVAAIIRAVLICFRTWEQNKKAEKNVWLWHIFNRKSDWDLAAREFRSYREAGSAFPPSPDEESNLIANGDEDGKGRALGGPFLARLYNFVSFIPSVKEPFDFPLGMASFLYFSHLEARGEMKIENRKEFEIRNEMAAHRAAAENEVEA